MAFFAQEDKSNHSKSLPKFIKVVFAQCHGSSLRTPSCLSSVDESPYSDMDHKEVIILEIRSRAMKAKSKPKELLFSGRLTWAMSPTTGRVHMTPIKKMEGEKEFDHLEDEDEDDDQSEAFFSVKSCFSCCSADGSSKFQLRGRPIWEEFRHCQGWPFGLWRTAVALPPLPSSPSDSWMWHKRNLVTRTASPQVQG